MHEISAIVRRMGCVVVVYSKITQVNQIGIIAWVIDAEGAVILSKEISTSQKNSQGHLNPLAALIKRVRQQVLPGHLDKAADPSGARRDLCLMEDDDELVASEPTQSDDDDILRDCFDLLISPLSSAIGDAQRLLIVPDAELYALPFAALLGPDGRRLIERHTLQIAPSLGTLRELLQRTGGAMDRSAESALVVGEPIHGGPQVSLPGASEEALVVHKLISRQCKSSLLCKQDACKGAVVAAMPDCSYIHLAAHGSPDGIYLGGATKSEGKLSLADVQRLRLRARLVVLSACNSFRGELRSDGVVGIARAFMVAGAQTIVASMWPVDDAATLSFMTRFYERGGATDAAAACQGAMHSMLQEGSFRLWQWAPFVVYGLGSDR